jgi:hypothetical protein
MEGFFPFFLFFFFYFPVSLFITDAMSSFHISHLLSQFVSSSISLGFDVRAVIEDLEDGRWTNPSAEHSSHSR